MVPPDRGQLAAVLNDMSGLEMHRRNYREAEVLRRRALALTTAELGPEHPQNAALLALLASTVVALGRTDEAKALFEQALMLRERALGPEHPDLISTLDAFANLLLRTGDVPRARAMLERTVALVERTLPANHPMRTDVMQSRVEVLMQQGDFVEAMRVGYIVLERQRAHLGFGHHSTTHVATKIAESAMRLDDRETARAICESLLTAEIADRYIRASATTCLGELELRAGKLEAARATLTKALAMYPRRGDPYNAAWTKFLIATALPPAERQRAIELAREARQLIDDEPKLFSHELGVIDAWAAKLDIRI